MFNNFKTIIKGLCAVVILSTVTAGTANAQLGDAGEILRGGADDANALLQGYLTPFGEGFGANLNTGWFNQAKPHGTLGFDISVNAAVALVPNSDQTFNINELGLSQLQIASGPAESPTIAGDEGSTTKLELLGSYERPDGQQEEFIITDFDLPGGVGYPYVPSPMLQATVGIIKDTDVSLRFVPETNIGPIDASVGLFGFGVKHGINQWLPGGKVLPVDISIQFGYTSFNANTGFEVDPQVDSDTFNPFSGNPNQWEEQGLDMTTTATTINAIVGKKLPFISVYGGVGFENSTTSLSTPGSYPITSPATPEDQNEYPNEIYHPQNNPDGDKKIIKGIDSPIDLEIKGSNNIRAFVGARLSLAIFRISASYTQSTYSSFNVGVGFGLR